MATVRPVGRSWVLSWIENGSQKRKAVGKLATMSKREAEMIRKAKELELASGTRILNMPTSSISFGAFCTRYLDWRATQYPSSQPQAQSLILNHLKPRFKTLPISAVEMETYKAERLKEVKAATVVKELNTLKAMQERARLWKLIPEHDNERVENPQLLDSKPVSYFTIEQLDQLYSRETSAVYAAMWRLMVNTGLRRTEALQLRWVHIEPHAVRIVSYEGARTKAGKWREVPMNDGTRAALTTLASTSEFVLPRMTGPSMSRAFVRTLRHAKLPGSLHWLRHTFISHLVMRGVPLRTVQVLAGHSTIAVTERYAHLAPGHMKNVMEGFAL